jgi:hypothetical protein
VVGRAIVTAVVVGVGAGFFHRGTLGFVAPIENPFVVPGLPGEVASALAFASVLALFTGIVLGIVSIVLRYFRSRGVERQQIKWFAAAALLFGLVFISDFFVTLPGLWEGVKESLMGAFLPAAIGFAILRYRLYDIDIIIRKTLVYSVLTIVLALIYFGGIVLLQQLTRTITASSDLAIVVSTLVIAALFFPLRRRVQNAIDRRFYRRKYNAQKVLEQFAATAQAETDLNALTERLMTMVQETMQPASVSVWLIPARNGGRKTEGQWTSS